MATNQNRKKKPVNVKDRVAEPKPKRKSTSSGTGAAQTTRASGQSKGAAQKPSAKGGSDVWLWALGAIAATGTAYGVWKHIEANEHKVVADQANKRASAHHADAHSAKQHAEKMEEIATKERQRANRAEDRTREMEAKAAEERHRADVAEKRAIKLVKEVADRANSHIAELLRETAPPLRFDGCSAAATDGVEIRINMIWIFSAIVDPAEEAGAIFGRIIGAVAHEWYHYNDTSRGTRPLHDEELRADTYAGKLLAKLSVQPHHFADLLRVFPESSTHPDGRLRAQTMLNAYTAETQKKEREVAESITTIVTQPVTEAVVVGAQAPVRRPRNGAANKSAAKRKSTSKTGATKMSATKTATTGATKMSATKTVTTGTPKKRAAKRSTVGRQEGSEHVETTHAAVHH